MSSAKSPFNFVVHVPRKPDVSANRPGQNAFPRLLRGKKLKALVLPSNFDTSVHHAARVTGTVKGTPLSSLSERIAKLEKRKLQVG